MNIKLLKSIRIIACVPYLLWFGDAIYSLLFGTPVWGNTVAGIDAFIFTIIALGVEFFWVFAISAIIIVFTTVLIKKHK